MPIHGDGGHAAVVRELKFSPPDGWIIAVGHNSFRRDEVRHHAHCQFAIAIHPSAVISPTATIGEGSVVMAGVVVQARATIGRHVILNSCSSVDHHCIVEDYAHIGPGARLCGNVHVGEGAFLGAGSIAVPGTNILPWVLVKAGTVVK